MLLSAGRCLNNLKKRGDFLGMAHSSGTVLMTEGDYKKDIILYAIPVVIGDSFQQTNTTVDSLIVGY